MVAYYLIAHIEWLAGAVFLVSTIQWLRKGADGAPYTAVWWATSIGLGLLALYREAHLARALLP